MEIVNRKAKAAMQFLANQYQFQLLVARPALSKEPEFTPVIGSNDMDEIQEYSDLFKKDGYLVAVVKTEK
jgi:hypothetical protein